MYGKIFRSIFDSTLIEDRDATYTFICMIVLADRDGVVDMTRAALGRRINMPGDELGSAIEKLESPDSHSRHKAMAGSRIVRLEQDRDWGWRIVNYEIYRNIASDEDRREQNRIAQQRFRDKDKQPSSDVSSSKHTSDLNNQLSDQSAQGEGEGEGEVKAEAKGNTSCAERSANADAPPFITLPLNTGDEHPIHENQIAEWETLFPAVNTRQELRNMRAWLLANPTRRKTRKGVDRFVTSWFAREQDRGGKHSHAPPNGSRRKSFDDHHATLQAKIKEAAHGRQPIADAKRLD